MYIMGKIKEHICWRSYMENIDLTTSKEFFPIILYIIIYSTIVHALSYILTIDIIIFQKAQSHTSTVFGQFS